MKNITKSPITVLSAYDIHSQKSNAVEVDGRPFLSLTYRKSGIAKININNETIISKKDFITLTPKHSSYTTQILEDTHIIAIHFDCLKSSSFSEPFSFESPNPIILELFNKIFENYSADDIYNFECYSLFYKLLYEIEKQLKSDRKAKINPKISKAKSEIEKQFTDSDFNIDRLVASLPLNASYLRREFKKAYSLTPIEYLQNVRFQHALSLLASDAYSVNDIAKNCGYCSTSYFIQVFHKKTGFSPLKYKENYLDK